MSLRQPLNTTKDEGADEPIVYFYSLLRPSTFIRYWIDERGIMHQRVIEMETNG